MQCEICESEVSDRALFCEVCGHRVRRSQDPARGPSRGAKPAAPAPAGSRPSTAATIVPRDEVVAAVAARAELGTDLEPHVIDAFVDRIEDAVIARVDERIDARLRGKLPAVKKDDASLPVAICSLIFGIPLSAIAASAAGPAGLIVAWLGIAGVNFAVNLRKRSE
jgi:hypothetical protein